MPAPCLTQPSLTQVQLLSGLLVLCVLGLSACGDQKPPEPFEPLATNDNTFQTPQYATPSSSASRPWSMELWGNRPVILTQVNAQRQPSAELHVMQRESSGNITRIGGAAVNGEAARILLVGNYAAVPVLDTQNPRIFICTLNASNGCSATNTVNLPDVALDIAPFPSGNTIALAFSAETQIGLLDVSSPPSTLPDAALHNVSFRPSRLAAVDSNTLAVVDSVNEQVLIMDYNSGTGTFTENNPFSIGSGIANIATINNHVVVSSVGSESLVILQESGGSYTSTSYEIGGRPQTMLAAGRIGSEDLLLVGHRNLGYISALLFDTNGNVTSRSIGTTRDVTFVASGDFDATGQPDLAIIESLRRAVGILKGSGSGSSFTYDRSVIGTRSFMRSIHITDFDGENHDDILLLQPYQNRMVVFYSR